MSPDYDLEAVDTTHVLSSGGTHGEDYTVKIESNGDKVYRETGLTQDEAAVVLEILNDAYEQNRIAEAETQVNPQEAETKGGLTKRFEAEYVFQGLEDHKFEPDGLVDMVVRRLPDTMRSRPELDNPDNFGDTATVNIEGYREDLPGLEF